MENKKIKDNIDTKEEKKSKSWIIIGVMIGTVVGMTLSFSNNNIVFLGGGAIVGGLIGRLLGTIATEGIVIKVGTAKKKRKK